MIPTALRISRTGQLLAGFVFLQTAWLIGQRESWVVLSSWSMADGLYLTLVWMRLLALAAVSGLAAGLMLDSLEVSLGARRPAPSGVFLAVFAGTLFVTAILARFIAPTLIPPGVWIDILHETEVALRAPGSLPFWGASPFSPESGLKELASNLYIRYCEIIFRLFGRDELGFVAVSAVPGCLAVPAVGWLGAEAFGARTGMWAALLMAMSFWPLAVSRWSFIVIALVFLSLVAVAATLATCRTGRPSFALVSGAATGLLLHTHSSAWAVAGAIAAFWVLEARAGRLSRRLCVTAAVTAGLGFLPFAVHFAVRPGDIGGHLRDVHLGAPEKQLDVPRTGGLLALPVRLAYNAAHYSGMLLWVPDPCGRQALPGRPAMSLPVAVAALLGFAHALRGSERHRPENRLLLLVSAAGLAAGLFSKPASAPVTTRACALFGPAYVYAGMALGAAIHASSTRLKVRPVALAALAGSVVVLLETIPFLTVWPEASLTRREFAVTATEAGRLRRALGEGETVWDGSSDLFGLVFEAVSGPRDARSPVPPVRRATPDQLVAAGSTGPVWYVTTAAGLDRLRSSGWRCARGIAPNPDDPGVVVARAIPPRPGTITPLPVR